MLYRRKPQNSPLVDLSPLIDVVFLLLIFFMVSTRFKDDHGLNLSLPKSESKQATEQQQLVIAIDREGKIVLGSETVAKPALIEKIQEKLAGFDNKVVILKVDESVSHGTVFEVMDAAKSAGAEQLTFAASAKPPN